MRKRNALPSQEYLKRTFDYRDGCLLWKGPQSKRRKAGSVAGTITPRGYVRVGLNGVTYSAHRLIYKLVLGSEPFEIDHVNRVRHDNRVENLRPISRSGNTHNSKPKGMFGIRGVCWDSVQSRYRAQIYINKKKIDLGATKDFFEACCIRKRAELHHPDY